MITTTLNRIRAHNPCEEGWCKLLKHLGKTEANDAPLPLLTVLASNGADDTLWCLRSVPEESTRWRLYAVWCARQVQHLIEDPRSLRALDVAERYAKGLATDEELAAARGAAASGAARDASKAAWAAAEAAAMTAEWDATGAAWDAADVAADAAAAEAAAAADAAASAATRDDARDAARDAARQAQIEKLKEILA